MSFDNDKDTIKNLDVFKEIGNIGAGHAASALAGLLNTKISMTVPESSVVPFNSILGVMEGPETLIAGVLIDVSGDLNGYILLMLQLKDAMAMVSRALEQEPREVSDTECELTDMENDTLLEIANIIVGSFLSAISSFTGLKIIPAVPQLAIDMLGSILSIAMVEYGKIGDSCLFLKTQFVDPTEEISGHFFLIPDYNSYKILLKSLGLDD